MAKLENVAPFFIVGEILPAVTHYRERLGFDVTLLVPEDDPFFAIVERDAVRIMLKVTEVPPLPNPDRHPWAKWDAFVYAADPDELAAEFTARGVEFSDPLSDTEDGLRGFVVKDHDGYALFFGHPR